MMLFTLLGLIPGLFAMATQDSSEPQVVRRVIVQDQILISIPVRPRPKRSQNIEWREEKGPKCVRSERIAGAMWSGPSSIDFLLRDRTRVRAIMDDECPALDFYKGFYLQPDDDRICAKRESIQSRIGGSCRIERFKSLTRQVKQVKR